MLLPQGRPSEREGKALLCTCVAFRVGWRMRIKKEGFPSLLLRLSTENLPYRPRPRLKRRTSGFFSLPLQIETFPRKKEHVLLLLCALLLLVLSFTDVGICFTPQSGHLRRHLGDKEGSGGKLRISSSVQYCTPTEYASIIRSTNL